MTEDVCRRWLKGNFRRARVRDLNSYEVRHETKCIFFCF